MRLLCLAGLFVQTFLLAQTDVWFVYGSKLKKEFQSTQRRWFGGIKGGHVGIGNSPDSILHFVLRGKIRIFPGAKAEGKFRMNNQQEFIHIFQRTDSIKYLRIRIPEKKIPDSLISRYLQQSPYDYAFLGMRCAAATANILHEMGILKGSRKPWIRYFYPALLRKKMLRLARKNNWEVIKQSGTYKRKWEK